MLILGSPFAHPPGTMLSAIQRLGLTSGLKLCLDASDIDSYSGAGQSWLDTSGNGYDFFRGTTSAAQATDPTFNGSAGGQSSSEYWSFDGGDFFTYDTTNETWMQNYHKDNAVLSIAAWVYLAAAGDQQVLLGNTTFQDRIGFAFYASSANTLRYGVLRGTDGSQAFIAGTLSIPTGQWSFVGLTLTEATGASGAVFQVNGTQETASSTFSSPSSSSASHTVSIGHDPDASTPSEYILNGGRMANLSAWEGTAITAVQLNDMYTATKSKFGL